ncbi:MAG: type II toxin-antitoxin system MqsR family toxin [Rubrivivax sp.]|nr:type II toxin-antitoxin system MqsR family toxin [Rubrivivax sp.]
MPAYDLVDVHFLVQAEAYVFATPDCRSDVRGLGLTEAQAASILLLLQPVDFRSIFHTPCKHDFGTSVCDDYVIWVDLVAMQRCAKGAGEKLYIKLTIDTDPTYGDGLLVISFHESKR